MVDEAVFGVYAREVDLAYEVDDGSFFGIALRDEDSEGVDSVFVNAL